MGGFGRAIKEAAASLNRGANNVKPGRVDIQVVSPTGVPVGVAGVREEVAAALRELMPAAIMGGAGSDFGALVAGVREYAGEVVAFSLIQAKAEKDYGIQITLSEVQAYLAAVAQNRDYQAAVAALAPTHGRRPRTGPAAVIQALKRGFKTGLGGGGGNEY